MPEKKLSKRDKQRLQMRQALWPDAEAEVWSRHNEDGFATIPRLLPLVMTLMDELESGYISRVYVDLWARAYDDGLIEIDDEGEFAFGSGFVSNRAVRTWSEYMLKLQKLGLIRIKPSGNKEIGYVLLIHPLKAAVRIIKKREKTHPALYSIWWPAFVRRVQKVGAELPECKDE